MTTGTPRRFRLTQNAFHGGRFRNRGETIELAPGETPGDHMIPADDDAPPIKPLIVRALPAESYIRDIEPPASPLVRDGMSHVASGPGFVVLDTETNGFSDPRVAGFALIFASPTLEIEHEVSFHVRPVGWSMSQEATGVNGLTDEFLHERGIDVAAARFMWRAAIALGRRPIGHNLAFDLRVMANEFEHAGEEIPPADARLCTLEPARRRATSGALAIAYREIVGAEMPGAHDALNDARGTLRLFAKLVELGEITP